MKATELEKERMQKYYRNNTEKIKIRTKQWSENNHCKVLFNCTKIRAKKKGILFNIVLEDIVIPKICPFLKITLTSYQGLGKIDSNAMLKRIPFFLALSFVQLNKTLQ